MIGGKKKSASKQPAKEDKIPDEVRMLAMSMEILYYYTSNQLGRRGTQGETKRREEKSR